VNEAGFTSILFHKALSLQGQLVEGQGMDDRLARKSQLVQNETKVDALVVGLPIGKSGRKGTDSDKRV